MNIAASFEESFGYGFFISTLVRGLLEQNHEVNIIPLFGHNVPVDLLPYVKPKAKADIVAISMPQLPTWKERTKAIFTMWEASEVPSCYGPEFKKFANVIVPTEWSRGAMKRWHRKIHLCPLGVDAEWSPPSFTPMTFTVVAADHMAPERKRVQDIADTFSATFRNESDVRLLLKRNLECKPIITFDNRIEVVKGRISRKDYNALLARTTVGVQFCVAEGWSLPVNEFIRAGKPVICARAGAVGDYLPENVCFPLGFKQRKSPPSVYLGVGTVPHASTADLASQMRFAYENRFEVVRRGVAAREFSTNFTAHKMVNRFIKLCQTLSLLPVQRPAQ